MVADGGEGYIVQARLWYAFDVRRCALSRDPFWSCMVPLCISPLAEATSFLCLGIDSG